MVELGLGCDKIPFYEIISIIVKVETKQATAELGPNWDGLILVELVSKVNICMYNGSRLRF